MAATLRLLYKDINKVDLWVGGIAEDAEAGSELGETFRTIIVDQFVRVRDGDRFWYKNILSEKVCEKRNNLISSILIVTSYSAQSLFSNLVFKEPKSVCFFGDVSASDHEKKFF